MYRKFFATLLIMFFSLLIIGCGPSNPDAHGNSASDKLGGSHTFYIDQTANSHTSDAVLKKVVADVATAQGTKTLKIWVDKKSFGSQCHKAKCITQEMVNALADAFLKPGEDNDIYDWDTAIYGEEWGEVAHNKYANVIKADNEINILLTDIDNDNSPRGGAIGYFYPKDNYTRNTISGSNERIMFYIDSVMFANDEGGLAGWNIRDRFPQETLSTLAHEFQHMIHFYQKTVLLADGTPTATWIDEMLAETTEDIVASRIGIDGPRGVEPTDGSAGEANNTLGRYPGFNAYGRAHSLTHWEYNNVAEYSKVSAFGTFLIRNYGGAKLLHNIMHNQYTDKQAISTGIEKTTGSYVALDSLLQNWGAAVLLSDKTTLPYYAPQYNTGDFQETSYNDITYEMGSINFFNYTPKPALSTTIEPIAPMSNLFYLIGENITGEHNISLDLKTSTSITLVIKNHQGNGSNIGDPAVYHYDESGERTRIQVNVGADPVVDTLASGKKVDLTIDLGNDTAKDVYLVFSNTGSNTDNESSITAGSSKGKRLRRTSSGISAPRRKVIPRPLSAALRNVHQFNRRISQYLIPNKKENE